MRNLVVRTVRGLHLQCVHKRVDVIYHGQLLEKQHESDTVQMHARVRRAQGRCTLTMHTGKRQRRDNIQHLKQEQAQNEKRQIASVGAAAKIASPAAPTARSGSSCEHPRGIRREWAIASGGSIKQTVVVVLFIVVVAASCSSISHRLRHRRHRNSSSNCHRDPHHPEWPQPSTINSGECVAAAATLKLPSPTIDWA